MAVILSETEPVGLGKQNGTEALREGSRGTERQQGGGWPAAGGEERREGSAPPDVPIYKSRREVMALGFHQCDGVSHGGELPASSLLLGRDSQAKIVLWRSWSVSGSKPLWQ